MNLLWLNQFAVLLWKNFVLKKRKVISLIVEIFMTLFFSGLILLHRRDVKKEFQNVTIYRSLFVLFPPPFLYNRSVVYEVAYVPSHSDVAKNITETVIMKLRLNISVRGFSSEAEFEKYVEFEKKPEVRVLAAIVFDHDFKNRHDSLPLKVKYHLRLGAGTERPSALQSFVNGWNTHLLFPNTPSLGPRNPFEDDGGSPRYIREGFLIFQYAVDQAIMMYHNGRRIETIFGDFFIRIRRFPYPAYYKDDFLWLFLSLFPLVVILVFSLTELTLIRTIVSEKEKRLKEYQLMIGLSNAMLWASYFVSFFLMFVIITCLLCMILFVKIVPEVVFQYSDPSLVFVFFLCFVVSSISFGFLISTLFNTAITLLPVGWFLQSRESYLLPIMKYSKTMSGESLCQSQAEATLAVSFGGFFYFVTFFLYVFVSTAYEYMTLTEKLAFCLCSNVAVALGIDFICRMEMKQYGVQWDNILSPVNPHDSLIFAHIMGMLLFDAFLYGLMTWYIDAVFPGKYGVPKPWYFFVQKSYWFNKALSIKKEERQITDMIKSDYFEDEPVDLVVGIRIQNLYKEFTTERDTILAVKNLSFNVYEGQITVLLGPNGAGKTTTMSILTGLTLPTSGKVYINGYDISKDMNHVRNNLGFCPQDDILFAELTVSEHLYFYCVIKGVPPEIRPTEVNKMLTSFGLLEKHDAIAKSLSGGMKRKLSIIIALIGGSKVVILDEPTSGMDPVSRRFTWNVLQQYKHDRTILLTTHHMDEADVLGDRIAIMVKGSLCCCGSSIFLKRIYGVGYHIIIVKEPHCDVEQITRLVEQHVPDARLETNVAAELSFILPKKHTDRFTGLLTDLEKSQEKLGIGSFGVSITTMEEVFLKVSTENNEAFQTLSLKDKNRRENMNQNMNVPRSFERSYSPTSSEHSNIMFNTGPTRRQTEVTIWFNNQAYHSPPLSLTVLDNIIFMALSGPNASITVSNKPQPLNAASKKLEKRKLTGAQVALNLFFGMSIFVSSFCLLTVTERITKAKHIQFVSGVSATNFWLSALLWDFLIFFIACCLLMMVFLLSGLDALTKNYRFLDTLFIFMLFGWAVIPFTYLISFLFSSHTSAYIKLVMFQYCAGVFSVILNVIVTEISGQKPSESLLLNSLMVIPIHNFGMSISKYYDNQETKIVCSSANIPAFVNCSKAITEMNVYSLEDDAIGRYLIAMAVTGFIFFLLIFLLETTSWKVRTFVYRYIFFEIYKKFNKDRVSKELSGESEDDDVQHERNRILEQPRELLNFTVLIKELTKIYFTYPAVLAVRNISLGIQKKECFGLLGLNGAGKTTTFEILTGEETATSGDVFIENLSITNNLLEVRSKIGYCPQFDALLDYMTARELMVMYARLWGVPETQITQYVNKLLQSLNLEPYADKFIYTYSGGNKRRLSNAIALMGKPSVIFLDEPSTGMDPEARRLLWNRVTRARESDKVIIITSHSMEECDALCTRLAIMVKGKIMCLGSPQHLKNKFGNVYTLKAKFKIDTDEKTLEDFKKYIATVFPGSELKHENQGILNYYIPSKDNGWGKVFGILEEANKKFHLEDYSISQITLEEVFMTFAKQENIEA
ncbi:phospholipid-transporting ATPase ABCA3-like isoform X10 [Canis lupus baileyi]|uniref:ATP-binding cassette sub-family A member 3-like isoform X10 n=1 Tax=Canis lupus familiaris TaxID=9615 RepID=UPI0006B3E595|nr:ATP-binding cassette sub-family A member 3-like isoform X10 [Canis lupus familiaris]XP_038396052.1 ATP-binding cassette sub-family A member 3-like isoform X10 [Canis lupus familiaris]XP_038524856.1 ATP-binding cassette sub-family A member 3-like isoform X10 [Canis lupus familiaris]|eukprot:XP_013970044.1 ATP-binding cassette sub-family A member 3-like isoform X10 [Canis lupus familiaris]